MKIEAPQVPPIPEATYDMSRLNIPGGGQGTGDRGQEGQGTGDKVKCLALLWQGGQGGFHTLPTVPVPWYNPSRQTIGESMALHKTFP